MSFNRARLIHVVQKYGVLWAPPGQEFTLASGAKSQFYIDFSRVVMVPEGAVTITEGLIDTIAGLDYDRIGGPMSGADPIIGGLMNSLYYNRRDAKGFVIRKEPKGRGPGAGDMYEGYLDRGDKVVLIEDVTTSGGSVLKAIKAVDDRGATVVKVITLLDRLAGAADKLKNYNFTSLITLDDLNLKQ